MPYVKDIAGLREQIIANATIIFRAIIEDYQQAEGSSPHGHPLEIILFLDPFSSPRVHYAYLVNKYSVKDGRVIAQPSIIAEGFPADSELKALYNLFKTTAEALGNVVYYVTEPLDRTPANDCGMGKIDRRKEEFHRYDKRGAGCVPLG